MRLLDCQTVRLSDCQDRHIVTVILPNCLTVRVTLLLDLLTDLMIEVLAGTALHETVGLSRLSRPSYCQDCQIVTVKTVR